MKILSTIYGSLTTDERGDSKMIDAVERGGYPAQDEIIDVLELVTNQSVVADVGANIGTFTLPLARVAKEVHAFEPMERNVELLRKNIELNALHNVVVHPVAVGQEEGRTSFVMENPDNAGTYRAEKGEAVKIISLDSTNIPFDIIKMDIQGMEGRALMGAAQLVQKHHPLFFFEVSGRIFDYGPSLSILHTLLRDYRYYLKYKPGSNRYGAVLSLRVAIALMLPKVYFFSREGFHFDILAAPKERRIEADGYLQTFFALFLQLFVKAFRAIKR